MNSINAICSVINSTTKVTGSQSYIFEQAFSMFILQTFAAENEPFSEKVVRAAAGKLADKFKWFYLDNSAFFPKKKSKYGGLPSKYGDMGRMYWDVGIYCFEQFFKGRLAQSWI